METLNSKDVNIKESRIQELWTIRFHKGGLAITWESDDCCESVEFEDKEYLLGCRIANILTNSCEHLSDNVLPTGREVKLFKVLD